MKDGKIAFGIIGCGVIGPWHAGAIARVENATLVAVCDKVEERAKNLAEKYGADYYTDYRHLLERQEIDVVCICLPSGMHAEFGIQCAQAGKHIVCEKPLDITLEKIDAFIAAARENKVKLAGIFQRRFQPNSIRVKQAIESGRLGRIHTADCYIKWYRTQAYYDSGDWRGTWALDGGGCLMNQGVHGIDLLQWLVGKVKSVYAVTGCVAHERIEVEDQAFALVEFANGAKGVIEGSTSCYPGLPTIHQIHGTNGSVGLEEEKLSLWKFVDLDEKVKAAREQAKSENRAMEELYDDEIREYVNMLQTANEKKAAVDTGDPQAVLGLPGSSHYPQIKDMVEAILEDRPPACTGEDARHAVEIILAIYQSAREGRKVELPL
ncbi:MAG: Gfo/Idh/MocA family oxidoreductase [Abditibacteriales bacterium]|nr:Gfo/Idh/MocA family oxidoreductase [Abditibacteriales bacterium]